FWLLLHPSTLRKSSQASPFSLGHEYLPGIRIDEMYAFAGDALDGLIDGTGVVRVVSKPGLDLQRSFWTDGRSNRHVTPIETKSRRPRCCQPGPPRSSFLNWGELGAIPHKPTLSRESGSRAFQGPLALRWPTGA